MEKKDIISISGIVHKDLEVNVPEEADEQQLLSAIVDRVTWMLRCDKDLLMSYLYRLDVLEHKINAALLCFIIETSTFRILFITNKHNEQNMAPAALAVAKENLQKKGYLDLDVDPTLDLVAEINKLKKEKNMIILAHYYQESEIQDVADYIGDSLGLSQKAATTEADIIVFAGVHFMAETTDICCTSTNAKTIVESVPKDKGIIFAPDKNLGAWLIKKTGRDLVLWNGACMVHEIFSNEKITKLQIRHPEAKFIAHPECEAHILDKADFIGSTSQLIKFTEENDAEKFIVATESGILHQMQLKSPNKTFIPAPPNNTCACNDCPFMKRNTMEKLYLTMKHDLPEVTLSDEVIEKGLPSITKMLEISKAAGL